MMTVATPKTRSRQALGSALLALLMGAAMAAEDPAVTAQRGA